MTVCHPGDGRPCAPRARRQQVADRSRLPAMNAIEGRVIRDRTLFATPGLAPLGAAPLWVMASPAGIHPGTGGTVLLLVVLGPLGFGRVRLTARGAGRGGAGPPQAARATVSPGPRVRAP